ncbi:MAG: carboxymuconolactone decarboxylase family protein [Proteobacteria bacterium]|nr:carboxymuconolactone decarboxylase family protein [Pseudomonadota bacterium]MBU2468692.1 carboxymuconolactone decarboxylase family protein [Pseudomonadota bacterium]MBU2517596.1 carboxymuconolactone decarboxylase family protein [Pseudomonadota bacterium]
MPCASPLGQNNRHSHSSPKGAARYNAPHTLAELKDGLSRLKDILPATVEGYFDYVDTVSAPGALDSKTKELIAIGIIAYHRCEDCIALHVNKALDLGASKQDILEAALMATVFGGGPSMGITASHILPAIEQYQRERGGK